MQGFAGGAHAVAVVRGVVDDTGGRRTCRQQAKSLPEAQWAGGADDGRDTGQRHVFANVQVAADTDAAEILGQAQTVDIDVVGVRQLIGGGAQRIQRVDNSRHLARWTRAIGVGRGNSASVEPGLRQDVRGLAVVDAEGAVQPLR
ncbi:hypothetical protein D9M73_192660 [compost metagenome]